jgi:hypothetical protein
VDNEPPINAEPFTASVLNGDVVPIPTLPPPVANKMPPEKVLVAMVEVAVR